MSQESEIKVSNKVQNSDILKSLESLVDETLQIYEFNSEEENVIGEMCETIALMLTQFRTSVTIAPSLLGSNNNVKRAVLGQDGRVMITYRDDEVEHKQLTDFRASLLMDIFNDIFPKLKDAAADYRKTIEGRLSIYRTANKKMKKIEHVMKEEQKASMEDIIEEGLQPSPARLK